MRYDCMMPENDEREDRVKRGIAVTAGAIVGAAVGGPAGSVMGAAAGVALEPLAERVWQEVSADGRKRASDALYYAYTASSLNDEEFERLITKDERARLSSGIVISAATRTTWDSKLRALGYCLYQGLLDEDEAVVSLEEMILAAVVDIEQPHLALLDLIVTYEPIQFAGQQKPKRLDIPSDSAFTSPMNGEVSWTVGRRKWPKSQIERERSRLAPVLPSLLGTLLRHGLILEEANTDENISRFAKKLEAETRRLNGPTSRGGSSNSVPRVNLRPGDLKPPHWSPTELGELVWRRFNDAGADVPDKWTAR